VRLVIADDSAVVREGLLHALQARGHEVVATAVDADSLLARVEARAPDVAIVDIRMPPTHTDEGLRAASLIRARTPEIGVLVLSQYVEPGYALTLLRDSPASCGYLLKDRVTQLSTLLDAIERVGRGETVIDPELVELLLRRPSSADRIADLTERERTVLALVAEGLSDRAIAGRLWLTPKTVETHVRHILAKLALPPDADHNRRVLAVLAFLRGSPDPADVQG
jgi:DNA-binding NarL/FixJ family response regulator